MAHHALNNPAELARIIQLVQTTGLNTLVLDYKNDWGYLSYPTRSPLGNSAGGNRLTVRGLPERLAELSAQKIYTVARIVAFKDNLLSKTYPQLMARQPHTGVPWRDFLNNAWADPFRDEVWAYLLTVAGEAARLGFDEIQFDALHFPPPDSGGSPAFLRPLTPETRLKAIAGFLSAARGQLAGQAKLSATLPGYACWRSDDCLAGQTIERLAPYVDILSPLLYPSAFTNGIPGCPETTDCPYDAVYRSTRQIVARAKAIAPDCHVRPWIQDFRDNRPGRGRFSAAEIQAQIRGVFEGGAVGYTAWDSKLAYTAAAYELASS